MNNDRDEKKNEIKVDLIPGNEEPNYMTDPLHNVEIYIREKLELSEESQNRILEKLRQARLDNGVPDTGLVE